MRKRPDIKLTERAVQRRINRALLADREMVCKARGAAAIAQLGVYFRVRLDDERLLETHVNLDSIARKLHVLAEWESIESLG